VVRRRQLTLSAIVVAVSCLTGAARAQSADPLEDGRRLKAELRYDEARAAVERVLRSGVGGPQQLAETYRLLGELAAGMDERVAAEAYFARLLSLQPEATLGSGASPKLTVPFDAARARLGQGGLVVSHRLDAHRASLVVERDPLDLVAGARARYRRGMRPVEQVEARGRGTIELSFAGTGPVQVELAAIDEFGNELVVFANLEAGQVARRSRSLIGRWQLWAGIGVALGATGAGFGLAARSAESDLAALNERARNEPFAIDFGEAETLRDRAGRRALIANLCFAGTAAVGVAAAVLLVRELRAPGEGDRLSVGPALGPDSIGVAVGGAF
jgi:hypothetical protein